MQSQALEDPRRAKITGELPSRARPRAVTGQRHLQCLAICDALPEQCRQRVGVQRQADVAAQSPGEAPRNERTEHWPGGWRKTRHPSADVQCHLAPVTFSPRPRHAPTQRVLGPDGRGLAPPLLQRSATAARGPIHASYTNRSTAAVSEAEPAAPAPTGGQCHHASRRGPGPAPAGSDGSRRL